jgi:flagellar hook assembly protein FlgD
MMFALRTAQPNPFRSSMTIAFELAEARDVRLSVYDAMGRQVRTLVEGARETGAYEAIWDGMNRSGERVVRGVYFVRIEAGAFEASQRVVVLR